MQIWVVYECGTTPADRAIAFIEQRLGHGDGAPHPLATHVFLIVAYDDGSRRGYEAVPPAVRSFDPAEKRGRTLRGYAVSCTPQQAHAIHASLVTLVGHPYSFDAVLSALVSLAEGHPEHWWGNPLCFVDCVQMAADVLRGAGLRFGGDVPAYDLTPSGTEMTLDDSFAFSADLGL